jgi:thiamine pyrophosphate-dependent acetolactate synthase large subunit-like protein
MQASKVLGTGFQQEVHLERLLADVAGYNAMVHVPSSIPSLVDAAVRTSLGRRTVSHITFPVDIQESPANTDPWEAGLGVARTPATAPTFIEPPGMPPDAHLERAAEVLNHGWRVVTLVGAGARHAREQVVETADVLASPIVKALSGKAAVPDDNPLTTGGIGLLGTRPSEEAMEQADTVLMVGTGFRTAFLPDPQRIACVQIDADPVRTGTPAAYGSPVRR